jgi:hypothetical protein
MTSDLNTHFPSFTSIQCPVTPRNPAFVVPTDQLSAVVETFPGAAWNNHVSLLCSSMRKSVPHFDITFQLFQPSDKLVVEVCFDIVPCRQVRFCRPGPHRY